MADNKNVLNQEKTAERDKLSLIMRVIAEHIDETNIQSDSGQDGQSVFVFATGVSADLWADWTVKHPEITGVTAVATDRFIAWDDFKSNSIKSHVEGKKTIPSVMRTVFSANLISENALSPFLKNLIVPEYAKNASSFASWISSLLPSLSSWKQKFDKAGKGKDDEDDDLLALYEKYKSFLDSHNLFDPAWETPPFVADGNTYYIFYPEVLMDFTEYKALLESAPQIKLITLSDSDRSSDTANSSAGNEKPSADFFENSRAELRHVALYIRYLHNKKNIPWEEIAVDVPDLQSYAPYLTRELDLYEIPHSLRMGLPLTSSGTGNFFVQLQNCVQTDFSFNSVKTLLLNTELPWKEPELNSELVQFGKENNCLCSYEYNGSKVDVWKESFKALHDNSYYRLEELYDSLKKEVSAIVNAKTFDDINKAYFIFKPHFFNTDLFSDKSNSIMSRCITELASLIDIEKEFPDCTDPSPYTFFTNALSNTQYLAQSEEHGVQIFPYKLASTAPFASHIVVDSSQASISILFKQLQFLREDKRTLLGLEDTNPSESFIKLYEMNSTQGAYFTAAAQTFSGYSLVHSALQENDVRSGKNGADASCPDDSYSHEKDYLLEKSKEFPDFITRTQKNGYSNWKQAQTDNSESSVTPSAKKIEEAIRRNVYDKQNGKIRISETSLKKFYECPRAWLFNYVLSLKQENNEAELMDRYAPGNLNHNILQSFCTLLKKNGDLPLHTQNGKLTPEYETILSHSFDDAFNRFRASPLAKQLLETEHDALYEKTENAIILFCHYFEGYRIYDIEKELAYEPEGKNFFYKGRADCILKDNNGSLVLVDFKSSSGGIPKDELYAENEGDIPAFQMPLYILMLEHSRDEKGNPYKIDTSTYFNLKDGGITVVTGSVPDPDSGKEITGKNFAPTIARTEQLAENFARCIEKSDFSVDGDSHGFEVCNACDYRAVCRRTFTVSRSKE
jgi:hypothetical protein